MMHQVEVDQSAIDCEETIVWLFMVFFFSKLSWKKICLVSVRSWCTWKKKRHHGSWVVRLTIDIGRCQAKYAYLQGVKRVGKTGRCIRTKKNEAKNHSRHTNPNSHEYKSYPTFPQCPRWLCLRQYIVALRKAVAFVPLNAAQAACSASLQAFGYSWVEGHCCY